ncbi:YdcF family protein [Roseomonas populi]|uniref:YdcF family protein n=1 Tax=Roseomonas populi TaxID=3121582 RepID=A0ABT1XCF5_9PROT|nr:YdcF family protein [Roseomonas pecuniae]MCR0985810.1 YdcF family protein [Roseomonas pecuniae]
MSATAARPKGRRLPLLSTFMAAFVLAVSGGFLWFLHRSAAPAPEIPPTPGIAVLTGGPDRVEAGLALLEARPEARLIVSGVGPDAGLAELVRSAGGRGATMDPAALADRIVLGREATSTRGNAREIAAWARRAEIREITVITAGFHMPRALLELRRDLPEAVLHPRPVEPFVARPVPMIREYVKLIGAALNLSTLLERPGRRGPAR